MHKQLVAGLSRLVTCLQSNFIGTNFAGFCSNLGIRGLFSSPFVSYWVHIDWLDPGYMMGTGNPTISRETETQVRAACQPRQPHTKIQISWYRYQVGAMIFWRGWFEHWRKQILGRASLAPWGRYAGRPKLWICGGKIGNGISEKEKEMIEDIGVRMLNVFGDK